MIISCNNSNLSKADIYKGYKNACKDHTKDLYEHKPGFEITSVNGGKDDEVKLILGKYESETIYVAEVSFKTDENENDHCICLFNDNSEILNPSGKIEYD